MLERGELVGMFPQGTSLPYRRRPWRSGAARLAKEKGVPLVPVCLVNTERVLRPRKLKIGLPKVLDPRRRAARPGLRHRRQITQEARRRVEELRAPYGPPAHVWLDAASSAVALLRRVTPAARAPARARPLRPRPPRSRRRS